MLIAAPQPLSAAPRRHFLAAACLSVMLAACGGGGGGSGSSEPAGNLGDLRDAQAINTLTAASISQAAAQPDSWFKGLAARYDVKTYRLNYITSDAAGRKLLASGLLSVPVKPDGASSPVLSYQHATIFRNAEAPSQNVVASEPPAQLAAQGYIVVAADYIGFGASYGTQHPYMEATPTARAVVDMLQASRAWQSQNQVRDNGQLFMMGYSEGGYATMAAHRLIQQTGGSMLGSLKAAIPGAGPYDVKAALDGLLEQTVAKYPELQGIVTPENLSQLGDTTRKRLRQLMVLVLLHNNQGDVVFRVDGIDRYLAGDLDGLARYNSVHLGWAPTAPVYLFHGKDDKTVPYAASTSALQALRQQGATAVSLTDCTASPADHLPCVPEYLRFALDRMGALAQNL